MTIVHAQLVGDKAVLPGVELEKLVELAGQNEPVHLELDEDDAPTVALMKLAEQGGAFDFWHDEGENIYSETDGTPL
jgi:hypothetical protein